MSDDVPILVLMQDIAGADDAFRSKLPPIVRWAFWTAARARMEAADLDAATRERIEAVLARRVPPLTPAERREFEA